MKRRLVIGFLFIIFSCTAGAQDNNTHLEDKTRSPFDGDKLTSEAIKFCNGSRKIKTKVLKDYIFKCSPGKRMHWSHLEIQSIELKKIIIKGSLYKEERVGEWQMSDGHVKTYRPDYSVFVDLDYKISISDFGILKVWGSITNNSDVYFRDPPLRCKIYGSSGTQIQEKTTKVFQDFPSYITKKFGEINLSFVNEQAESVFCELRLPDLRIPEYPFKY